MERESRKREDYLGLFPMKLNEVTRRVMTRIHTGTRGGGDGEEQFLEQFGVDLPRWKGGHAGNSLRFVAGVVKFPLKLNASLTRSHVTFFTSS